MSRTKIDVLSMFLPCFFFIIIIIVKEKVIFVTEQMNMKTVQTFTVFMLLMKQF